MDCLINNFIEKEILDAYLPLHFSQSMFLMPPFCVTRGFITPVGKANYKKILLGICLHVIARVYYSIVLYDQFMQMSFNSLVIFMALGNSATYCVAIVITYVINVTQSHNALQVLLKLRHALLLIDMQKSDILKHFKMWNYFYIVVVLWFNVAFSVYNSQQSENIGFILGKLTYLVCDLQLVCLSRTVSFGSSILASWNRKMNIYMNKKEAAMDKKEMLAMFKAYVYVIDALGLCKKVYQFTILYQLIAVFNHALYSVELEIARSKIKDGDFFLRQFMICVWSCKSIILLANLSAACERFYQKTQIAEMVCAQANTIGVSTEFDVETHRTCKNVVRCNRAVFARLSVFDACVVDATMPLRLLLAVGTYTVVLLQFALNGNH